MVKRFDQTGILAPVNLSTGGAQALQQEAQDLRGLSSSFARFEQQRRAKKADEAFQAGRVAHAKGETEKKEETFFGGIEAKAFNRGLQAGYEADISNDNRAKLAEIERENGTDSQAYSDAVTAHRAALQKNVDPAILPDVMERFDTYSTAGMIRVQDAQAQKDRLQNAQSVQDQIKTLGSESANAARSGDVNGSGQKLLELFNAVDGAVESGLMTPKEAANTKRKHEMQATQENLIGMVRGLTETDPIKAIEVAESLRSKTIKGFSADEQSDLVTAVISDINQSLSLKSKREAQEDEDADTQQEQNSQALFNGIITGAATPNDVISASQRGDIDEGQARTLINIMNTQGTGVDDFQLINDIESRIDAGESVSRVISDNVGTRLTQATAGTLLDASRESIADGSPLQTEKYKSALSFLEGSVAVRGPLGALDTESERRLAKMRREVRSRVLQGEDPFEVVDQIIPKDEFNRAPSPMFGEKGDLNSSLTQLNDQYRAGAIDDDTYNFQFELIERLKGMKQNLDNFNQANKDQQNVVR